MTGVSELVSYASQLVIFLLAMYAINKFHEKREPKL